MRCTDTGEIRKKMKTAVPSSMGMPKESCGCMRTRQSRWTCWLGQFHAHLVGFDVEVEMKFGCRRACALRQITTRGLCQKDAFGARSIGVEVFGRGDVCAHPNQCNFDLLSCWLQEKTPDQRAEFITKFHCKKNIDVAYVGITLLTTLTINYFHILFNNLSKYPCSIPIVYP